jgi:hypothetical protein
MSDSYMLRMIGELDGFLEVAFAVCFFGVRAVVTGTEIIWVLSSKEPYRRIDRWERAAHPVRTSR